MDCGTWNIDLNNFTVGDVTLKKKLVLGDSLRHFTDKKIFGGYLPDISEKYYAVSESLAQWRNCCWALHSGTETSGFDYDEKRVSLLVNAQVAQEALRLKRLPHEASIKYSILIYSLVSRSLQTCRNFPSRFPWIYLAYDTRKLRREILKLDMWRK